MLAACTYPVSPALFLWMTPTLVGLGLAMPLVAMTASSIVGGALRKAGLLQISEERTPPCVLVRPAALREAFVAGTEETISKLLSDQALLAYHVAMLPPPRQQGHGTLDVALVVDLAKIADATGLAAAIASLTETEKAAVLGNADGIKQLLQRFHERRDLWAGG